MTPADSRAPFSPMGVLDHLHQHRIAFAHTVRDAGIIAGIFGQAARFAQRQEAGMMLADFHKGGLHARHHALHPAQHDIADQGVAAASANLVAKGALKGQLFQLAVRHQRDADFPCPRIDEDFNGHAFAQ